MNARDKTPLRAQIADRLADRTLSTEQAAAALHIKPQTLRAAVCRAGHYAGIRPHKLPSRFLAWPAEAIERLLTGEETAS